MTQSGLIAFGLLALGFITGRMPMTVVSAEPSRETNPVFFWLVGAVYAFVGAIGLYIAIQEMLAR